MMTLTVTQWNALTFIQHYQQRWEVAPKVVSIQHGCALGSKQAALDLLCEMQAMGLVSSKHHRYSVAASGCVGFAPPSPWIYYERERP